MPVDIIFDQGPHVTADDADGRGSLRAPVSRRQWLAGAAAAAGTIALGSPDAALAHGVLNGEGPVPVDPAAAPFVFDEITITQLQQGMSITDR